MEQVSKVQRRDKITITTDILEAVKYKQLKVTHLLYKSNLSYPRLQHYLTQLMQNGMIEAVDTKAGKNYAITTAGLHFHRDCMQTMQDFRNMEM